VGAEKWSVRTCGLGVNICDRESSKAHTNTRACATYLQDLLEKHLLPQQAMLFQVAILPTKALNTAPFPVVFIEYILGSNYRRQVCGQCLSNFCHLRRRDDLLDGALGKVIHQDLDAFRLQGLMRRIGWATLGIWV